MGGGNKKKNGAKAAPPAVLPRAMLDEEELENVKVPPNPTLEEYQGFTTIEKKAHRMSRIKRYKEKRLQRRFDDHPVRKPQGLRGDPPAHQGPLRESLRPRRVPPKSCSGGGPPVHHLRQEVKRGVAGL